MEDNSPIILRLKKGSRHFQFFHYLLRVMDIILEDKRYSSESLSIASAGRLDRWVLTQLEEKFQFSSTDNQALQASMVSVSVNQMMSLLESVDVIANTLLNDEGGKLKSFVSAVYPDINEDWDVDFFKSAQFLFDDIKARYQNVPKLIAMIENISLHH